MSAAETAQIAELFCSDCYACDDIRDAVQRALSGAGRGYAADMRFIFHNRQNSKRAEKPVHKLITKYYK